MRNNFCSLKIPESTKFFKNLIRSFSEKYFIFLILQASYRQQDFSVIVMKDNSPLKY